MVSSSARAAHRTCKSEDGDDDWTRSPTSRFDGANGVHRVGNEYLVGDTSSPSKGLSDVLAS